MPYLDYTLNVPTLLVVLGVLIRGWSFLSRLEFKINTMWVQFLLDHPEYERRENMKKLILSLFAVALLSAFSSTLNAQAPGVNATVTWNTADTPAQAQAWVTTLKLDASGAVNLTPNCTTVNGVTACSASISGYVPGVHSVTITVTDSTNGNTASGTFTTKSGPAVPTGGKVVVIIIGNEDNN